MELNNCQISNILHCLGYKPNDIKGKLEHWAFKRFLWSLIFMSGFGFIEMFFIKNYDFRSFLAGIFIVLVYQIVGLYCDEKKKKEVLKDVTNSGMSFMSILIDNSYNENNRHN